MSGWTTRAKSGVRFSPDLEKNHAAWRGHRANWFHEADAALKIQLSGHESVPKRLRALWALYVSEGIEAADLIDLLRDSDEYVRSWAVQLLMNDIRLTEAGVAMLTEMARDEESPSFDCTSRVPPSGCR